MIRCIMVLILNYGCGLFPTATLLFPVLYAGRTNEIRRKARNKPTLVIAHNKTLAGQLYGEFKEFFPENAVEYFVS